MPDTDIIFGIPEGPPPAEPDRARSAWVGTSSRPRRSTPPSPQYTEIARKARIQGVVIVEAIIDKTGNVTNVKVLKGLPMGLDQAGGRRRLEVWKFKPATLNGKPVEPSSTT